MLKIDSYSYLYAEDTDTSPEIRLLVNVLERAIRDLSNAEHSVRKATKKWFKKKERLIPNGIGFGDIIDSEILNAKRQRALTQLLQPR